MWRENIKNLRKDINLILSDFSEGMVEEVKNKYHSCDNISCQQINIEKIPFPDHSFDIIIANMMLYHVPNLDQALSEVSRVLKKNGRFYAATYGENGIHNYIMSALKSHESNDTIINTFTLQNGDLILSKYFKYVEKKEYRDSLEITETLDLIDYIYSMTDIINVKEEDRDRLIEFFENRKDENGVIRIPKEYGMFISNNDR